MSIRHKAVKATLDQGKSTEWNDDHRADFASKLLADWNFVSTNIPDEFTVVVNNGGTADIEMYESHNFCKIESGGTADDYASLVLGDDDVTNKLNLPIFTTALVLGTTDRLEFGFFIYADVPATADQAGAYFRIFEGHIYAVTGDGAAETATDLGVASESAQYKIQFTSTDVRFYIDDLDSIKATHTANIPSVDLTLKFSAVRVPAGSQIMYLDAVALERLRKVV